MYKLFSNIFDENKIYKNFINGEWVFDPTGNIIEIKSPLDNSLVGKVQAMNKKDVDYVIKSSKEAQKKWREVPINVRADILNKAATLLEQNEKEMAEIMMMEVGKDIKSGISEVSRTADYIRFSADAAKNMAGENIPGESFPGFKKNKISIVTREALGVVLAISPFNYPINLSASKIAPALIVGNSVVLKPATQGSISSLYLARIFEEAGLPKGILNTITGRGSEIGDYIVSHPDIDFINFTGSTQIGKQIAGLVNMKPLLMELGGKDAAIVLEDADLDLTIDNIISGAFNYSGQRCTAVKRILVVDPIANTLIARIKSKVEQLKSGNPMHGDVQIVPLIDAKSADYVMELIDDAIKKGATLLTGGKREGNLVYPTLLDNVKENMDIAWDEPFGPVLPIIRVKDKDEAIAIANKSEYGLQSSVFTKNINDAFYVAERLEVGSVQINNKPERGPDHFPFMGVKSSGIGTQGIKYSIEAMSRPKAIVVNLN